MGRWCRGTGQVSQRCRDRMILNSPSPYVRYINFVLIIITEFLQLGSRTNGDVRSMHRGEETGNICREQNEPGVAGGC